MDCKILKSPRDCVNLLIAGAFSFTTVIISS